MSLCQLIALQRNRYFDHKTRCGHVTPGARKSYIALLYFLRFPQYILFRWNIDGYGILVKGDWSRIEEETGQALEQIRMVCEADIGDYDW